jgi:hypothetical protein
MATQVGEDGAAAFSVSRQTAGAFEVLSGAGLSVRNSPLRPFSSAGKRPVEGYDLLGYRIK